MQAAGDFSDGKNHLFVNSRQQLLDASCFEKPFSLTPPAPRLGGNVQNK